MNKFDKKLFSYRDEINLPELEKLIIDCEDVNIIDTEDDGKSLLESIVFEFGSEKGIEKIIKLLLKKGANVNYQDWYGSTALHMAIYSRSLPIITILLENNANPNLIKIEDSESVLDFALSEQFMSDDKTDYNQIEDIVKTLIQYNGKTRTLLFTRTVDTYLLVASGYPFGLYPTGLVTLNGNIFAEDIPCIDKEKCDEFMYWLMNVPSANLFENEPDNPLVLNYKRKRTFLKNISINYSLAIF